MREILFRGKRVDNDEWIEGFFAKSGDKTFILIDSDIAFGYVTMKEVLSETVGQYTGLTDKNGKKIFEGDIVELTYYTLPEERKVMAEVAYEEESAAFVLYSFGTEKKGICGEICDTNKVIGNIYDNPEMLED